jgi:tight adherence protein B
VTIAAAMAAGAFAYLLTGLLLGVSPVRPLARRRTRTGQTSSRQLWLTQAGARLTPRQFWLGSIGVGLGAFVVLGALVPTPVLAIIPAFTLGALPAAFLARQRATRLRAIQLAWPDALRELIGSITAGMSLERALIQLATGGPVPIRTAMGRFPTLARTLGTVPALEVLKEELAHPTSDRVIEVLILAQRRGGQVLTSILEELIEATSDDLNTQEEIKSNALEGKINARIVFALPWFVLLTLTAKSGPFQDFYRSPQGLAVVALSAAWSLLGLWLVGKLSRIRNEPRVFGTSAPEPAGRA